MAVYDLKTPVRAAFDYLNFEGTQLFAGDRVLDGIQALFAERAKVWGCDIETTGTGVLAYQVKVVTVGTPTCVVAFDARNPQQVEWLGYLLDDAPQLVFQGGTFDIPPMIYHGLMRPPVIERIWDTLVLARMAEPGDRVKGGRDLSGLAHKYLGLDIESGIEAAFKAAGYRTLAAGYANMDIDSPIYLRSAMTDTATTARLLPVLWDATMDRLTAGHPFDEKGVGKVEASRLIEREQIVNRVFLRRSALGLPVDVDYLDKYRDQHAAAVSATEVELQAYGIDPGNGQHLTNWLHNNGHLPDNWPKTKTGLFSATADDLEKLVHPLAQRFVDHKRQVKITGYLEKVADFAALDGRIHPHVNVLGADATGRMSYAGGIPLQQFPADARPIVASETGRRLYSIDWSSIEPILMANAAGETPMIDAFEGGADLYGPVMAATGVDRKTAKVVLLAAMYGQGAASLGLKLGMDEVSTARLRAQIMGAMPAIKAFLYQLKHIGNTTGKIITISGRILDIPFQKGQRAGYKAQNYFCQGSAYDILSESIVELHRRGLSEFVVLGMHDELVVDGSPDAVMEIRRVMENPPMALIDWAKRVPVLRTDVAGMGERWAKPE